MKGQESKYDHATALLLERRRAPHAFLRHGACGEGLATLDADQRAAFEERMRATAQGPWPGLHLGAFLH